MEKDKIQTGFDDSTKNEEFDLYTHEEAKDIYKNINIFKQPEDIVITKTIINEHSTEVPIEEHGRSRR